MIMPEAASISMYDEMKVMLDSQIMADVDDDVIDMVKEEYNQISSLLHQDLRHDGRRERKRWSRLEV